jgi:ubiquinone/menaquinone biosynthesis C-methylase UbiE
MTKWMYNEFKHCGVDYSDKKQADRYDILHQKFRNYEKEFGDMLDFIGLSNTQDMSIIDLGCGTGASSFFASNKFKTVFAVDVSDGMIAQARKKASDDNVKNLNFHIGGFLSYKHKSQAVDVIITKHAFHHLPDFWKQIALFRMNKMLKTNGILYICDVAFNIDSNNYKVKIDNWINGFEEFAGKELRSEVETHIRDEYSTFNWILEGMFSRAGFLMEKNKSSDGFVSEYLCRKSKEIEYYDE